MQTSGQIESGGDIWSGVTGFFWAVDTRFPIDELPKITGLMIGDAYNSEIIRMGPETKMASSRRKGIVHKFAVNAARRLHEIRDPIAGLQ